MKPETFSFERLPVHEARNIYPALWRTARYAMPHLNEEDIATVVSLVVDTCPSCHENPRDCQCWNDE